MVHTHIQNIINNLIISDGGNGMLLSLSEISYTQWLRMTLGASLWM